MCDGSGDQRERGEDGVLLALLTERPGAKECGKPPKTGKSSEMDSLLMLPEEMRPG